MPHKQNDDEKHGLLSRLAKAAKGESASAPNPAIDEPRHIQPPTRPIEPDAEGEKHDHLADHEAQAEDRQEALLDEALEETFPGSDPISPKHIT